MKSVSQKNMTKFPALEVGDRVLVLGSKISTLNGATGVVIEADKRGRSPYKSIYKVQLRGLPETGNPWYLFGNEIQKL